MTACAQATFETKLEAQRARRTLIRQRQIHTYNYLCQECQKYHLGISGRFFSEKDLGVVRLMAQGLTIPEIERVGGFGPSMSIKERIKRMKRRIYATSVTNLAVILVGLGEIDTRAIIAEVGEHHV